MGLILVVSEDLVDIETIRGALSVHGWWVTLAGDGEAALQIAADQAPKLVIVDHALPGSRDLVRNFGARGGGPGVLVPAAEGSDLSLELAEAGADEVLTKPVSAHAVLEAVKRCLAAPAPSQPSRSVPTAPLMTTDDIFGDVLREVEGEVGDLPEEAPLPAPAAAPAVSPNPAAFPAPGATPPAAAPERPVVSLAGLFEDEDGTEVAPVLPGSDLARAMEPERHVDASAASPGAELDSLWGSDGGVQEQTSMPEANWDGSERRNSSRPWNAAEESEPSSTFVPPATPQAPIIEPTPPEAETPAPSRELAAATAAEGAPAKAFEEAAESPADSAGEVEAATQGGESERSGWSPAVLWAAGLAAALLVAAGLYFGLRSGALMFGGSEAAPVAGTLQEAADAEALLVEDLAAEPTTGTAVHDPAEEAPVPIEATSAEATEGESIEELDLEAIVEQELGRREEELRRVFVEEEKRLLRELSKLDEEPEAGEDGGSDDESDDGEGGVGR